MYKKELHDQDNHNGVITHLEPDILECEVKWALGSITMNKVSGVDGIPVELFQILKDDAVKILHSICQHIWKTQQWPQDWERLVFIPIPKKGNAKECSNYCTIALISHTNKVMLKILQTRLQQYVNRELPDVQAGFRKGRGTRDQIANILSPCLFNFYAEYIMRNTGLEETQAGIKIVGRNINNLRYADDTTLIAESEEQLKSLLMTVKEESEHVGLKLNIQKMKIMASGPITSWEIDGEQWKQCQTLFFRGSKITADGDCSHEIKRCLLLGRNL